MSKTFCIIIPVYKTEKYLKRCVDSVLNQTFKNFELILIDDGSPDLCPKICDDYARKDRRVTVIHQSNNGVSYARNCGLNAATADWILFCDSDDWIENKTLEKAYSVIEKNQIDLIQFGFRYVYEKTIKNIYPDNDIENNVIFMHFCSMIIRREFLLNNFIYFPNNISFAEDSFFKYKLFSEKPNIKIVNFISYNYYVNSESVVQNISKKNILDEIYIIKREETLPIFSSKVLRWHKLHSKNKILFILKDSKLWKDTFEDLNYYAIFNQGFKNFIKTIIYLLGLGNIFEYIKKDLKYKNKV